MNDVEEPPTTRKNKSSKIFDFCCRFCKFPMAMHDIPDGECIPQQCDLMCMGDPDCTHPVNDYGNEICSAYFISCENCNQPLAQHRIPDGWTRPVPCILICAVGPGCTHPKDMEGYTSCSAHFNDCPQCGEPMISHQRRGNIAIPCRLICVGGKTCKHPINNEGIRECSSRALRARNGT